MHTAKASSRKRSAKFRRAYAPLGALCAAAILTVLIALASAPALAVVKSSARARVSITIEPTATITFPDGFNFVLKVLDRYRCSIPRGYRWDSHKNYHSSWDDHCWFWHEDWWWPAVLPARIPFRIEGNALASVSVSPGVFYRIRGGRYLGGASGPRGEMLGYDIVVHFPAPSPSYAWLGDWSDWDGWDDWRGWGGFGNLPSWSKWADLSGRNGVGTRPLTADMVQRHGKADGVIYLVARRDWNASGRAATPGYYYGSLEVTVTADNR